MHIEFPRTIVQLSGDDRVSFLNNFCTADITTMKSGDIKEAFVLGTKGKLVGHVLVFCKQEMLELNTVPGQAQNLIEHLDRYLIREEVELKERANVSFFAFGDESAEGLMSGTEPNRFTQAGPIQIAHCEAAGLGALLTGESAEQLQDYLTDQGSTPATEDQLQLHRLQHGTPLFAVDSNTDTLPQELQRDAKAISFTKGCYLGQETVARIDALGRVNKLLVKLRSNQALKPGTALLLDDKQVGEISSAATDGESHLGLAIVRRAAASAGTILNASDAPIEVIE